jgi:KDO2-lipid IV(A) lauroyltransferase
MAEEEAAPPMRWLFGNAAQRRCAVQYWISDTITGVTKTALHYAFRYLPIDVGSAIGGAVAGVTRYIHPDSDARARKLWKTLRPDQADDASTDAAMARLWNCVGRTMAEFSVLDRLYDAGRITVVGKDDLDAATATGRPLIGMGLHLGNWETIPATALALGYPGAAFYLPPDNRFEHRIAVRSRERFKGVSVRPDKSTAAFEAIKVIRRKKQSFLIYVDEYIRDRVQAPAFGRPIHAEGNAAYILRLAKMTNALIVPVYSVRVGGAHFKLTFLPPLEPVDTGDADADLLANVTMINNLIEPIVREHLDQWFYGLDFDFNK